MITLMHLEAGGGGVHIALTEGLAQLILLVLLIAVVAGVVAIWNRSRYRPYQSSNGWLSATTPWTPH